MTLNSVQQQLALLQARDQTEKTRNRTRREWEKDVDPKEVFWQVPQATAELLCKLIKETQPKSILEFGTSAGYSGLWMLFAAPKAHLHTIEFSEYRFNLAKESFANAKVSEQVTQYQGRIQEVLPTLHLKIDFLFIDAAKEQYLDNFKQVESQLTERAIIVADNMLDEPEKTNDFLAYAKEHYPAELLSIDNGVLIIRK